MCGRITLLTYEEISDVVRAVERGEASSVLALRESKRPQARPGDEVQGVIGTQSGLFIEPLTWGFASPDAQGLVFNTRIESALGGSRMWSDAIREGRCIVPVASFFEPHATETVLSPRTGKPIKQQYEFQAEDGAPLLLAGVHREGRLSVVTTEPNEAVAPIHARMPLALRFREARTWLEGDWASLADRSGMPLSVEPEFPRDDENQLSLF